MQAHIQETFHLLHVGHPVDLCICSIQGVGLLWHLEHRAQCSTFWLLETHREPSR